MAKKCPFRKLERTIDYDTKGNFIFPSMTVEEFEDCIGAKCMAWKGGPTDEPVPYVYNFCELTKGTLKP